MRRSAVLVGMLGLVVLVSGRTTTAQTASIVRDVRVAIACTDWPCSPKADFSEAEAILAQFRAANGDTSQALEALSWLGRGALAAKRFDRALGYAREAYDLSVAALKDRALERDTSLELALGAAIEVQGQARAAQGRRSDAVYFLRRELDTYRNTVLHMRIQKNVNLLSMEGESAPPLEVTEDLGRATPRFADLKGKVVVLFFWAHWCGDCKQQGPILATLLDQYGVAGLTVVAPTQRYGYTVKRQAATPAAELAHIAQVRDQFYPFLRDEAVPVSEANHKRYGVSTTPTLVVLDREGIVRVYHPGLMTAAALEAALKPLLARGRAN
jgi:thiol-disulfide isomerase/thioredoxin